MPAYLTIITAVLVLGEQMVYESPFEKNFSEGGENNKEKLC